MAFLIRMPRHPKERAVSGRYTCLQPTWRPRALSHFLNDCNMDMERLLEAFGSSFSLETVTSAYSQANHDVDLAGVILYELQNESKDGVDTASVSSSELSSEDTLKHPYTTEGYEKSLPENTYVFRSCGGDYLKPTNGSSKIHSPEVHSNDSLTSSSSNTGKDYSTHAHLEDFLLRMLGDGFQLNMETIHEVLGLCGYDLEKSMETLVDISASTLEKCDDVVSRSAEGESFLKIGSISDKSQSSSFLSNDRLEKRNAKKSCKKNNNKHDLQNEILGALFSAPKRVEEVPKKPSTRSMRPRLYGRVAVEPMKELTIEETFVAVNPLPGDGEAEEEENSFPALRQAVKENWATMREYFKSATDAFIQGDKVRADKLMTEGQFYYTKAREADEKSAQALSESREEDEMSLDISTLDLKEAIKLLKLHLSQLAGVQAIRFLKVFVGDRDGESKNGRLKRLVLKLLERASIECTEADDGKIIVIELSEINPETLKFSKD